MDEVLDLARTAAAAGCKEALFTLGDKPELRYKVARQELDEMGYTTTLEYLAAAAAAVLKETGLLPHLNPGVMTAGELAYLRKTGPSMGIMLESTSRKLLTRGFAHYGSPDKDPALRMETIDEAGRQKIPFTTGLLIGIGETCADRVETLAAIRDSHFATATSRRSSSRTSGRNRTPRCTPTPSRDWTRCWRPSPWPG